MDSEMTLITEEEDRVPRRAATATNTQVTQQVHLKLRRKTQSQWETSAEVPLEGEPCMATDSFQFKIGDGKNVWTALRLAWCSVDDGELS